MKFRAKMIDGNCIKSFMSILGCMTKLGKSCVLRITETHLYFIVRESQTISTSPLIWCTLEERHFFAEFGMSGLSPADNEIYLEFVADNVVKTLSALKVSTTAKTVKIKLTKKLASPCLTFEIDLPSGNNHSRLVVHDIPVNLVPRRLWLEYSEPDPVDSDISLHFPQLRLMKSIVERMKNLANMESLLLRERKQPSSAESNISLVSSTWLNLLISPNRTAYMISYLRVFQLNSLDATQVIEVKKIISFLRGIAIAVLDNTPTFRRCSVNIFDVFLDNFRFIFHKTGIVPPDFGCDCEPRKPLDYVEMAYPI
nr:EOG090X0TJE [Eurycercus lamellatus]